MPRHTFRSCKAAEGAPQVVNGEVFKPSHLVGRLFFASCFPAKQFADSSV